MRAGDDAFAGIAEEMRRQVGSGLRPSIQVVVDWRGERVFDWSCGEGARSDALYVLWSSTKPFVAVALLQLIEEGRAALDDPIVRTIPEFGGQGKRKASIAHVLTHRGGFPDNRPELNRGLASAARSWQGALDYVCQMQAVWEPGKDRGYHPGSGWFILGELIQRLDDRPLPEVLRKRVLDPLGIPRDAFSLGQPEALATAPLPVRTRPERGAPTEAEAAYWSDPETHARVLPGAGGISRAGEVVKLYRALLNGGEGEAGRILSPQMVRTATFPHVVGSQDRTFLRDIPWGLGFHLKHVRPSLDDCGRTATPGTFGHGGHFLVNTAWGDPGKDLAACILSNGLSEPRAGLRAVSELSQAIHDAIDRIRGAGPG